MTSFSIFGTDVIVLPCWMALQYICLKKFHMVMLSLTFMKWLSPAGTFGDHLMILGACCLYLVQFTILSSLGDNATAVVAPNESSTIMPDLPMLLLGHIAEGKGDHYVSLVGGTIRTPPLEQKASATQPIPPAQAASNMLTLSMPTPESIQGE